MSDTETDTTMAALREREQFLAKGLATYRLEIRILEAEQAELERCIEIVQRGGKRKPGPKTLGKMRDAVTSLPSLHEEPAPESTGEEPSGYAGGAGA